jgi:pimeloyl-ACP methyl ester carboxylesterase
MGEIFVRREGGGPEVVLVHGGASPERTWAALGELAARWTLVIPYRRGYEPSPPGRHDFELDATDLAPLLGVEVHLVTHSYGGLGALIAAGRKPGSVRSLTLIETPLFCVAPEDPEVVELQRLGDEFLLRGLEAEPRGLREFLAIAGVEGLTEEGPLPARVARAVRRSQGGRSPGEARPDLGALREAEVPVLVASGGHSGAQERICDRLAEELRAQREVFCGAGHFVQEAPGFGARLEEHLRAAEEAGGVEGSPAATN